MGETGPKAKVGYAGVTDSGEREEFQTGSVRDTRSGKGRYDLLPPIAIRRLAQHYENGARKYGERNWEKGQPLSRYADSALRHIYSWLEEKDEEDHLAAAAWNLLSIIHTEQKALDGYLPVELLDAGPNQGRGVEAPEGLAGFIEPLFGDDAQQVAGCRCPSCIRMEVGS